MSRYRQRPDKHTEKSLPHDQNGRKEQPYVREVEEYSGDAVKPPEQKTGVKDDEKAKRRK